MLSKKELFDFWKSLWIKSKTIELIICKITDFSKDQLFLIREDDIFFKDDKKYKIFLSYIERLKKQEPLEYILEEAEFMWNIFFVDKRVLIPRDDTSLLVFESLRYYKENKKESIFIDIWTWSSIIPISIIKNLPKNLLSKNIFYWVDISKKALEVAEINVKKYSLDSHIKLLIWDLLSPFLSQRNLLDNDLSSLIITANLPYIKKNDFENMDSQVYDFEPELALYWWEKTGFELYEKLIFQFIELRSLFKNLKYLVLFIEIWFDQYEVSRNFLTNQWLSFKYFKDTNNIYRLIKIIF